VSPASSSRVPPPTPVPPFPPDADPLIGVWPAGKDIVRVYDALYSPRRFWAGTPTRPGRFHPFTPAGAPGPVLYGSDRLAGAILFPKPCSTMSPSAAPNTCPAPRCAGNWPSP